ncbi:MAG: dihydrolipoamide acetyltransferase family protein [Capsulimonadaceae bacterium]|nr:dihydrolipoamide acetyltransferase family protein [Capsulimonadaceae bacterium]
MVDVIMPKMGDAMESGTLLAWKVKDGDPVKPGDVLAEIETDKSNVEIEAEDAGIFHASVQEGVAVPVGGVIATIGDASAVAQPASGPAAPKIETSSRRPPGAARLAEPSALSSPPSGASDVERVKASPLARRIARERGIDIALVRGTGPHGRIIEADVVAAAGTVPAAPRILPATAPAAPAPPAAAPAPPAPKVSLPAVEGDVVELSQMRRVIAKRMVDSKTTIPHFYLTADVDVEEMVALREKLNAYDTSLPKITLNDMVVKAAGKALVRHPEVNAAYRDGKIVRATGQHVGIAVALDDGLIVPVVRDASTISLREVAKRSRELAIKARGKKLAPNEYSGGTFTVSNLGTFEIDNFFAIIDPAQGAILAVSTIAKRAVVWDNDQIVARRRMNVTLSGDHRIMDGASGARFLQEVKRLIQNPLSLLE